MFKVLTNEQSVTYGETMEGGATGGATRRDA